MVYKNILILLAIILLYFIFESKSNNSVPKETVACDENLDNSCKMYNTRDVNSKCTSMCILKYQQSFNGNHTVSDKIHTCDCTLESFTQIESPDSFLPSVIPDDKLFSNRDYVQNQEESRYNKLIFG